jgi:hypothetical protein
MKSYTISIQDSGEPGKVVVAVATHETITVLAKNAEEVLDNLVSAVGDTKAMKPPLPGMNA